MIACNKAWTEAKLSKQIPEITLDFLFGFNQTWFSFLGRDLQFSFTQTFLMNRELVGKIGGVIKNKPSSVLHISSSSTFS